MDPTTADGSEKNPAQYDQQGHRIDDDNWEPEEPVDLKLSDADRAMPPAYRPRAQPRNFVYQTASGFVLIDINPCVCFGSFFIIWGFVLWAALGDEDDISADLNEIQGNIVRHWSWFYVFAINVFMFFCLYLVLSKYGDIRLGQKPDYNYVTWITMLFSAGIGIGLYFWGVQEPFWYYARLTRHNHMYIDESSRDAFRADAALYGFETSDFSDSVKSYNPAMGFTKSSRTLRALDGMNLAIFNWGYSASSTYVVIGLPLAYYHYNHNLPLSMRTAFYPLIGNRINGWVGDVIDISAICGTVFGVCTSLGLGIIQMSEGLNFLDDYFKTDGDAAKDLYSVLIVIITSIATISVVTGLEVGIRRMSELNFAISMTLFVLVFFMSDPSFFLDLLITTFTYHFQWLFYLTGYADAYEKYVPMDPKDPSTVSDANGISVGMGTLENWTAYWTVFYWAWWVSWSPFVGQFLARISKGRTIREFIVVNVGVTTLLVMIWFVVFGGQALKDQMTGESLGLNCLDLEKYCIVKDNDPRTTLIGNLQPGDRIPNCSPWDPLDNEKFLMHACYLGSSHPAGSGSMMLWRLLNTFPGGKDFLVPLGIVGLGIFFITSSDSASQVVDNIASNGSHEPPVWQRIFWAVTEGATALVLLHSGENVDTSLKNLRTVSIIFALPLTGIMLFMCYALWVGLRTEDGNIKPKNNWATRSVDAVSNLFGSFFCVGLLQNVNVPPMLRYVCCCFWDAGNNITNVVWAIVTACFPCVTQTKNYLEYSGLRRQTGLGATVGKFLWIFFIVAPWICIWIFYAMCEEQNGPVVHGCGDRGFSGIEGAVGVMYTIMVVVGVIQRAWIREIRGIDRPSNIITDACWFCFCPTVAIWQAALEPRVNVNQSNDMEGNNETAMADTKSFNQGPGDEQL